MIPVVIGIGNPLRQDDGMGWRAAELLEARVDADICVCHQLTPELAARLEGASLAIFLDASVAQAPGEACQRVVEPEGRFATSHHLTPGQLLSVAREVYGAAPPALSITGGAFALNLVDGLTAGAEVCAGRMAELAEAALGPR